MKIQVSELVVRYLEKLGIKFIFGMPGAHILPVYDSLYDSGIQTVLAKHEQGASFMACGDARASGRISACITTAGPGATNLVTGIANAYADKQPVLIITGETSTHIFGRGGLQESSGEGGSIDQSALFQGITRYNKIVERTDYLPNVLNQAANILLSDNPGPVLLSFPYNVQKELVDSDLLDSIHTSKPVYAEPHRPDSIAQLQELLVNAEHPVIVAGYGCIKANAQALVQQLSERMSIPVTTSLKAKGVVDEQSPWSLGSLGVTSSGFAYRHIIDRADLILFLGAGFNERTSYLWKRDLLHNKKLLQIDNNPAQIGKVFKADIAIQGDIHSVLDTLLKQLASNDIHRHAPAELPGTERLSQSNISGGDSIFDEKFFLIEKFFKKLEQCFPQDTMVFDDNIIYAQSFYNVSDKNHYYPNSGISSLGHAIPASIGARFSNPLTTFAIIGDGGFQMCCMELMTAVNYNIPVTVVMFNNSTMGLIRKNQYQQYGQRYIDCDFKNPDYASLCQSFGISYKHVSNEQELEHAFESTDFTGAINLIEIMIDKDAFPNYSSRR